MHWLHVHPDRQLFLAPPSPPTVDLSVTVMIVLVHCCSIFLWDLDWKYSARWEPSIWRCRLLSALQRAEMTDLDQIFCMRYFLCIWRAASKNFVHFLLLLPPQKGRSIRSGCFFQNYRSTVFLAWFFPFTNHATSLHARNAARAAILATQEEKLALIVTLRKILWTLGFPICQRLWATYPGLLHANPPLYCVFLLLA